MSRVMDFAVSAQKSKMEKFDVGQDISRTEAVKFWNNRDVSINTQTRMNGSLLFTTIDGIVVRVNKTLKSYKIVKSMNS